MNLVTIVVLGLMACGGFPSSVFAAGEVTFPPPKMVGDSMPSMVLSDLAGVKRQLPAPPWAGPVIVFFWSVYCPNCKEAMPGLIRIHDAWQKRGITVWAVNVDGERFSNAVKAYTQEMSLPFPIVMDRLEGEFLVAADALGVSKTPTLILAGPEGRIRVRQMIDVDYEVVAESLSELTR